MWWIARISFIYAEIGGVENAKCKMENAELLLISAMRKYLIYPPADIIRNFALCILHYALNSFACFFAGIATPAEEFAIYVLLKDKSKGVRNRLSVNPKDARAIILIFLF